jgi:hypothetical protein
VEQLKGTATMTSEVKAAIRGVQAELQQLDRRVSDANGSSSALGLAEALCALARMRDKVSKLTDGIDQSDAGDRGGRRRRK